MSINSLAADIRVRAHGRFIQASDDETLTLLKVIAPAGIHTDVCRLKRQTGNSGWRTILLASLAYDVELIHVAHSWAADARDQLSEPETADLYLFMLIAGIPDEEAVRIETDDQFCRKIVLRKNESTADLLDRTFLASIVNESASALLADPLRAALSETQNEHPWTESHVEAWRDLLLSGKVGSELAHELLSTSGNPGTPK